MPLDSSSVPSPESVVPLVSLGAAGEGAFESPLMPLDSSSVPSPESVVPLVSLGTAGEGACESLLTPLDSSSVPSPESFVPLEVPVPRQPSPTQLAEGLAPVPQVCVSTEDLPAKEGEAKVSITIIYIHPQPPTIIRSTKNLPSHADPVLSMPGPHVYSPPPLPQRSQVWVSVVPSPVHTVPDL